MSHMFLIFFKLSFNTHEQAEVQTSANTLY